MTTSTPWTARVSACAVLVTLAAAPAAAWSDAARLTLDPLSDQSIILVGHDVNAAPSVPRFAVVVAAVGQPNAKGEIYSFKISLDQNPPTVGRDGQPVYKQVFALNEIRSWRITVVSGELLGSEFQVAGNDELNVTVTDDFGPLNGLAEGDLMLVEQVAVRLPPQKLY